MHTSCERRAAPLTVTTLVKVQVRDIQRNLRSYFIVFVIRAVSRPRTDAARWCAGRSNTYWIITAVFPESKGHRSERSSCQYSLSNLCPLLFCVCSFVSNFLVRSCGAITRGQPGRGCVAYSACLVGAAAACSVSYW
jgi:hypothetical protein